MATKIINAGKILEKKGVAMKQFDTGAFGTVVEEFFMNHDISATILLSPKRFIEMKEPPKGDFIDFLDETIWERKSNDPNDPFDFLQLMEMQQKDLIRPILLVNEPFIGNAAAYLRDFCGFSVKSRVRKKKREYIVSLPV